MHPRTRFHAFSLIPTLALSLLAQSQEPSPVAAPTPPAAAAAEPTVKIAAHASRWDYPRNLAVPPSTQIHYVVKGDTLWDLGAKYLGNPFAWPQIWELNKWVKDPHWIYPGDPLLVDGGRATVAHAGTNLDQEVAGLQPDVKRASKRTRDEFAFTFQDFIQMPFLAPMGIAGYAKKVGALRIVGQEDPTKAMQADGDVVYLNGGANQGFRVGDRLVTFKVSYEKFYHPDDRNHRTSMGDVLRQDGILRITHAYPSESVAIVERSLDGIASGSYATTYLEPATMVTHLRTDIADPIEVKSPGAKIIFIHENKDIAASGEMVIIDQGDKAGLKVGDMLLIARPLPLDPTLKSAAKDITNIYQGQAIVVRTEEQTATCRLLRSKVEVQVGDLLTR